MDQAYKLTKLNDKTFYTILKFLNENELSLILFDINQDFRKKIILVAKLDHNIITEVITF